MALNFWGISGPEKEVILPFLTALGFYFVYSLVGAFWKKADKVCKVCLSFFSSWAVFLILYWMKIFSSSLVLGIFMGGSAVGIFNLLKEKLGIFKFPFVLSLFSFILFLLQGEAQKEILLFLVFVWLLFGFLYVFSTKKSYLKTLLECCKNW